MSELLERHEAEIAHAVGRAASVGRTLALPVDLEAGEHLRDAAFRAVSRNGFSNSAVVLKLAKSNSFKSLASLHGAAADDIGRLIDVLGIRKDADAVKQFLTATPGCSRDWVEFFGVNLRRGHLTSRRRVSPTVLRKHGTQKAMWSLQPLGFDVATKEELLDHCPVCKCELGWSGNFGVNYCDSCARPGQAAIDLRDFPQPLADIQDEEAVQFFSDLVDPEAAHRRSKLELHPELTQLGRGDLFQLAIQIAGRLDKTPPGWVDCLTVSSIGRAGRAIMEWPNGFDLLAESLDTASRDEAEPGVGFDRLHVDRTLSAQVRKILKQRFEKRLRKRIARKIDWSSPLTGIRPARTLKHSRGELKRLASSPTDVSPIDAAVLLLRNSPHARNIAAELGLPLPFLVDLFDAGMLPELSPLLKEVRGSCTGLWGTSVRDQLSRTTSSAATDNMLPLWPTCFALTHLSGPHWVRIFQAIVDGDLQTARWRPSGPALVKQLRFEDIGALTHVLYFGISSSNTDKVPMTQCDASFALGRSRMTVHNLIKNEMLPSNPTGLDVVELRRNWMFLTEIGDLTSLGRKDVPNLRQVLGASNVARISIGDTTLWSRLGVGECLSIGLGEYRAFRSRPSSPS